MLHRIAMQEEDSDEGSSLSVPASEIEKLDLNPEPSQTGSSSSSSGRRPSPMRKGSSFHLHHHRRSSSHGSVDRKKKKEDHLARWLQAGNVIYKSVGLGLMDLTVGMGLIDFAREKGVGTHIEGF